MTLGKQSLFKQNVKQATGNTALSESSTCLLRQHFSCDIPHFMMHSEASAASISLHPDNTASLYKPDSHKQTSSVRCRFTGLTERADMTPKCGHTEDKENFIKRKTTRTGDNVEEESTAVASNQLLTEGMWRQKEHENLLTSNMDLTALLQGRVKCSKGKPPSTKQTRKEAFDRYMNIIYGLPPNSEFDFEDTLDPDTFSFHPEPNNNTSCDPPARQEDVHPESRLIIPVTVEENKQKKPPAQSFKPRTLMKFKPLPERVVPKKEEPPEIISPTERPKPQTPPPPSPRPRTPRPLTPRLLTPRPRAPTPLPPREPTPEVPTFLKQFADTSWFRDVFPDKMSIPSTLSPEDFSLQLLGSLTTCSTPSKMKIVVALQSLHSQGLLQNTDKLYQGLVDLLPAFAKPHMSPLERTVLEEVLNLLVHLKPATCDLVKKLLTLLAFKRLVLGETVVRVLTALGVDEAEQWLWPELESWDLELRDQSNVWKSLHDRADWWLQSWTSKFKEHDRYLNFKGSAKQQPSSFSVVDVLNYFCSIQKEEEYRKALCVAPAGHNNTVLLPLHDCGSSPIFRLGETYSMSRIRRPPGVPLPPLRNRPFLTHFPHFISLPFSRVTLRPFHVYSDADWLKASPHRYFIQQQSFMEYYR
ncbi:WD repeat-containing protein 97 isoform X2 [Hippoglossus hippoglossus]|uniref:WD repeat-containing protein 97 isoform X2 n=1 Tax=Hippoglossus hippoglossus TaxID=8267 RepID=UPI00148DD835|nr:WD repeat-containing protein 97 isoform X2 [Hippoglossus hippoglossus]